MENLMCPRTEITIAGTRGILKCNGDFRLYCLGSNCAEYPCDAIPWKMSDSVKDSLTYDVPPETKAKILKQIAKAEVLHSRQYQIFYDMADMTEGVYTIAFGQVKSSFRTLRKQPPDHKVTVVGDPMTLSAFGQLLKDMYKKDENGVPRWKKVFGVEKE